MDDLYKATVAVLYATWGEGAFAWSAHAKHNYNAECAVCRGDVAAIVEAAAPILLAEQAATIARLETEWEEQRAKRAEWHHKFVGAHRERNALKERIASVVTPLTDPLQVGIADDDVAKLCAEIVEKLTGAGEPCCAGHRKPGPTPGWCINSAFDGCEPCCARCPDYDTNPDAAPVLGSQVDATRADSTGSGGA